MIFNIKTMLSKNIFYVFRYRMSLLLFVCLLVFHTTVVLAQGTVTESINILLNREVMQTMQVGSVGVSVTITTDNTNTVSLRMLDPNDGTFDVNSGVLPGTTKAANNGQITFLVKGLSHGTATLTFDTDTGSNTAKQLVNVIGIEAKIGVDNPFGTAPLSLLFTGKSEVADGISIARVWDFGSDSNAFDITNQGGSDNKNKTVEFKKEGVHDVTLTITATIPDIGFVTDSVRTSVCVFPEEGMETGTATAVRGVVWNERDIDGVTVLTPLPFVIVTLVGKEDVVKPTGILGTYRFEEIEAGIYTIFACRIFGNCINGGEFTISDGQVITKEFVFRSEEKKETN